MKIDHSGISGAAMVRPAKSHGHPLYRCFTSMMTRCFNPKNKKYPTYGGRGITVCDRWRKGDGVLNGFNCFLIDMGERPSTKHSIERKDNDGNYEPSNCRWATNKEQARNKRNTVILEWEGESVTLPDLCERFGVERRLVWRRLFLLNWPLEEALTRPKNFLNRAYQ